MILYHASTVPIEDFYIPYGGLHLGGLYSSLEAALRKLRSCKNVDNADTVYLHKCTVELGTITLAEDAGGCDSWRDIIKECTALGFDSVQYNNKFEPDVVPSYMVWDSSRVKVLECDPIHMDDAEDMLQDLYN